MGLVSFLDTWRTKSKGNFECNLSSLRGLYLIEDSSGNAVISYFPKSILPHKANERFFELFKIRPKWNKCDILPYSNPELNQVEDLCATAKDLDIMILKYARVTGKGAKTYLTNKQASF
jgi:hypothetical protein